MGWATVAELQAANDGVRVELLVADLAFQASIRQLAQEVGRRTDWLDVLVSDADGFWATRHTTVDGLEWTFAVNHLAYFLLTNLLVDLLRPVPRPGSSA